MNKKQEPHFSIPRKWLPTKSVFLNSRNSVKPDQIKKKYDSRAKLPPMSSEHRSEKLTGIEKKLGNSLKLEGKAFSGDDARMSYKAFKEIVTRDKDQVLNDHISRLRSYDTEDRQLVDCLRNVITKVPKPPRTVTK